MQNSYDPENLQETDMSDPHQEEGRKGKEGCSQGPFKIEKRHE